MEFDERLESLRFENNQFVESGLQNQVEQREMMIR